MHLSKLTIKNFRCFKDVEILLRPGLNVFIGENNAGKTALVDAIRLVFERSNSRVSAYDFHYLALETDAPPVITITATLELAEDDPPEEQAVVATWLTKFENPLEAQLTFQIALPDEFHARYKALRLEVEGPESEKSLHAVEVLLEEGQFSTQYFGGKPESKFGAETDLRKFFECRYLDAIRDVEKDLQSGKAPLLKKMLTKILDSAVAPELLSNLRQDFKQTGTALLGNLKSRLDHGKLFGLAGEIWGSGTPAEPQLFGRLSERDLLRALLLFLESKVHAHPVSHNGLGFNNLLYIALVLASLDSSSEGSEATYPFLIVEEPEAHLHPSLQYRFLVFLKEQLAEPENRRRTRQIFLTSHSTQVTSAVGLDSLVCLYLDEKNTPHVSYPGRAFSDSPADQRSKAYVERFLDATKSSILFAKSVIFVEGITEQLLVPLLLDMAFPGQTAWLDRNYVALVRVDGLTFKNFLPLFGFSSSPESSSYGLVNRRVACISDTDPRRPNPIDDTKTVKCWPFEDGAVASPTAKSIQSIEKDSGGRIAVCFASKTFEYDLTLANPTLDELLSDVCSAEKYKALNDLMLGTINYQSDLLKAWWPEESLAIATFENSGEQKEKVAAAALATFYLRAYEKTKGEHASAVVFNLKQRQTKNPGTSSVVVPPYIEKAARHVCNLEPLPD